MPASCQLIWVLKSVIHSIIILWYGQVCLLSNKSQLTADECDGTPCTDECDGTPRDAPAVRKMSGSC